MTPVCVRKVFNVYHSDRRLVDAIHFKMCSSQQGMPVSRLHVEQLSLLLLLSLTRGFVVVFAVPLYAA